MNDSTNYVSGKENSDIEKLANTDLAGVGGKQPSDSQPQNQSNVVDWDGPEDPRKPINWSSKKKWMNIILISSLTLLTPFGSSMLAPGVPQLMEEFQSNNVDLASFVVSIYLLGYAFGPLVIAPLSELYGRLPLYHVNTALFIVFNIACGKSTNLTMLIVFRFLTGIAGSGPLTVGPGTIADCFKQEERGKVMSMYTLPVLLGPTLGPVAGGYLTEAFGWRSNFWFLAVAAAALFIPSLILQRETFAVTLLERKTRSLKKATGNQALVSVLQSSKTPRDLFITSIIRPLKLLCLSPVVFGLSLFTAVSYGLLYLMFTTMTEIFQDQYGFSSGSAGLLFLGVGVGNIGGLLIFAAVSDRLLQRMAKGGEMKPEYRLPPIIPGSFLIPIGLLLYGWTTQYKVHWIVPLIGTAFVGWGMITVFMPVGTYLVDAFTTYAASATAANTVLRSLGGALLPLCGGRMYITLGLGWGNSLLAFIAAAMIPMVVAFHIYGERIRKSPRFQIEL